MTRSAYERICGYVNWPVADEKTFRAINFLERHGQVFGGSYGVLNARRRALEWRRQIRARRRIAADVLTKTLELSVLIM